MVLKYGLKPIKGKKGEIIGYGISGKTKIVQNRSGFGIYKDKPFEVQIPGVGNKNFKNQTSALNYFKRFKQARKKEINKLFMKIK